VNPRLLKSDQDGIERKQLQQERQLHSQLKSDQDGIERAQWRICKARRLRLKSDQDGIERREQAWLLFFVAAVKIRPRWD